MTYVVTTEKGFWNGNREVFDLDTVEFCKNLISATKEALKAKETLNTEIAIIADYGFETEEVIEVF